MTKQPRVTVGLPVYNGGKYLRQAIESVIAQTFQDWELVISDNCSTDATESICREYAAREPRIRYYRNQKNLGGVPNHNRTFELSRGEYFKFFAHDDVILPTFLERCIEVLDRHPHLVMVHTKTMKVDADMNELGPNPWHLRTDSPDPRVRFKDLVWVPHHSFQIYSVMRSDVLRQTPLFGRFLSHDQLLLAEMSLRGPFQEVDEFLFLSRRHSEQSVSQLPDYMRGKPRTFFGRIGQLPHLGWTDPSKSRSLSFPMWRISVEYLRAVARSPISFSTKLWCWSSLMLFYCTCGHRFGRDILVAIDQSIQQTSWAERIARNRLQATSRSSQS